MPKPDAKVLVATVMLVDEHERRIAALEAHIADLEERLNDRGVFSGDGLCTVAGNPAHVWESNA